MSSRFGVVVLHWTCGIVQARSIVVCVTISGELGARYHQNPADHRFEHDCSQAQLAIYDSRSKAYGHSLCVGHERLETYLHASELLHLRLESDLFSGLAKF